MFVRSIVRKGPADNGLAGLLVNDIILKVNGQACPLGPRSRVVDLIKVRDNTGSSVTEMTFRVAGHPS